MFDFSHGNSAKLQLITMWRKRKLITICHRNHPPKREHLDNRAQQIQENIFNFPLFTLSSFVLSKLSAEAIRRTFPPPFHPTGTTRPPLCLIFFFFFRVTPLSELHRVLGIGTGSINYRALQKLAMSIAFKHPHATRTRATTWNDDDRLAHRF